MTPNPFPKPGDVYLFFGNGHSLTYSYPIANDKKTCYLIPGSILMCTSVHGTKWLTCDAFTKEPAEIVLYNEHWKMLERLDMLERLEMDKTNVP